MPTSSNSTVRKGSFRPIQAQSLSRDNLTFGRNAISAEPVTPKEPVTAPKELIPVGKLDLSAVRLVNSPGRIRPATGFTGAGFKLSDWKTEVAADGSITLVKKKRQDYEGSESLILEPAYEVYATGGAIAEGFGPLHIEERTKARPSRGRKNYRRGSQGEAG